MTRLAAILADPEIRLLSVDLFDTLLLRGTRPEFVRFADVARLQHRALGAASPGPGPLLAARLRLTRLAYAAARADKGEVRFDAILARLCAEFALAAAHVETLRRVELDYETDHLRPNRALAAALTASGRPWLVASDTPLRGEDLAELLRRLLPELPPPPILASADIGVTKRDGGLFAHLVATTGLPAGSILHLGDHPHSDVAMAGRHGLRCLHLPRPAWWRLLHRLRAGLSRRRLRRRGLIP